LPKLLGISVSTLVEERIQLRMRRQSVPKSGRLRDRVLVADQIVTLHGTSGKKKPGRLQDLELVVGLLEFLHKP